MKSVLENGWPLTAGSLRQVEKYREKVKVEKHGLTEATQRVVCNISLCQILFCPVCSVQGSVWVCMYLHTLSQSLSMDSCSKK